MLFVNKYILRMKAQFYNDPNLHRKETFVLLYFQAKKKERKNILKSHFFK